MNHWERLLVGMVVLCVLFLLGISLWFLWWLVPAVVAFYAGSYVVGTVVVKLLDAIR